MYIRLAEALFGTEKNLIPYCKQKGPIQILQVNFICTIYSGMYVHKKKKKVGPLTHPRFLFLLTNNLTHKSYIYSMMRMKMLLVMIMH
jgi:hypothetical protein